MKNYFWRQKDETASPKMNGQRHLRFAAIDIGSNATRLLFCDVYEEKGKAFFKKSELIRVPLRLGEDSFIRGRISEEKIQKLVLTMQAFKSLIAVNDALAYRACGTSAMREASNKRQVINKVKDASGISIEVIDGQTEADLIYSNHIAEHLDPKKSYLYIDIGGGSTEITLFARGKCINSNSFNIGTIRLLHNQVDKKAWNALKEWVARNTKEYKPWVGIGSGGNINKLYKMSGKKEDKPLSYAKLDKLYEFLKSFSVGDRIRILGLKPDRADVIIPASQIVLTVMKAAEIDRIIVPQIGLSDGIAHQLYDTYKKSRETKR